MQLGRSKLLDKFRRIQLNNDFQDDLLSVIVEELEHGNMTMEVDGVKPLIAQTDETKENTPIEEDGMTEHGNSWLIILIIPLS